MTEFKYIKFEQPAGAFLLTVLPAELIIKISRYSPRTVSNITAETEGGINRRVSKERLNEIIQYCNTSDASFPTAIILALIGQRGYSLGQETIDFDGSECAYIVDGQHRMSALEKCDEKVLRSFNVPVVLVVEPKIEESAILFATINGKQTKVDKSLIYDLFGLSKWRSPQRTSHEVVKALNTDPKSPLHRRIKMLGFKVTDEETFSQGAFVDSIIPLISSNPVEDAESIRQGIAPKRDQGSDTRPFRRFFLAEEDHIIIRILLNFFSALENAWPSDYRDTKLSVLLKSTGIQGLMRSLKDIAEDGLTNGDLSIDYFSKGFEKVKKSKEYDQLRRNALEIAKSNNRLNIGDSDIFFLNDLFPSGKIGIAKISELLKKGFN